MSATLQYVIQSPAEEALRRQDLLGCGLAVLFATGSYLGTGVPRVTFPLMSW